MQLLDFVAHEDQEKSLLVDTSRGCAIGPVTRYKTMPEDVDDGDPETFLARLPSDDFTEEENSLRQRLFRAWQELTSNSTQRSSALQRCRCLLAWRGRRMRLSCTCFTKAKPGSRTSKTIQMWPWPVEQ